MNTDRRTFIKTGAILTAGAAVTLSHAGALATTMIPMGGTGNFELPPLGYSADALEPFIDAQTMNIHHSKHHQAYVNKLNEAIEKEGELKGRPLDELLKDINKLPESVRTAIRNNGGGHWNHSFFWTILKKDTKPGPATVAKINRTFGSMDKMKKEFEKAATGVFGSGWAWMVLDKGKLSISSTPNQDNPLMDVVAKQGQPVFGLDVWEHAYYLKHQNKRADYIQDFWNVLNWDKVESLIKG